MIFDLTERFKNELNKYPNNSNQSYTPPKMSPNLKFYATYSEDIYQLMIKIKTILLDNK